MQTEMDFSNPLMEYLAMY